MSSRRHKITSLAKNRLELGSKSNRIATYGLRHPGAFWAPGLKKWRNKLSPFPGRKMS